MSRATRMRTVAGVAWRVLVIGIVYAVAGGLLDVLNKPSPSNYPGILGIALVSGVCSALVMLPLARRLRYRLRTRFIVIFAPLYWIGLLSNLVEAAVDTSLPKAELIGGAVILAIPYLLLAWMIAWLLPARPAEGPVIGIRESLAERPFLSWVWRIAVTGALFAGLVELFGILWGPLIARYYHGGAYAAQAHTVIAPNYVVWPEEFLRGVVFVIVLLPLLAVMRGRDWRPLLGLAAYVALIDAVLESWLPMLSMTTFPLGFRLGEGLDLTTDAIARGVYVAVLLALPAVRQTVAPADDALGVAPSPGGAGL